MPPVGYCRSLIVKHSVSDYIDMIDDDVILHQLWMEKVRRSPQFKPDIVAGRVKLDPNLPHKIVKYLKERAYYNELLYVINRPVEHVK